MSPKSFARTTRTVSAKALRSLWRAIGALMAGFVSVLVDGTKNTSAAEEDPTSGTSILAEASRYEADDWVARNYDQD